MLHPTVAICELLPVRSTTPSLIKLDSALFGNETCRQREVWTHTHTYTRAHKIHTQTDISAKSQWQEREASLQQIGRDILYTSPASPLLVLVDSWGFLCSPQTELKSALASFPSPSPHPLWEMHMLFFLSFFALGFGVSPSVAR